MADVISDVSLNVPTDLKNPMKIAEKLPTSIVSQLLKGGKFMAGLIIFLVGGLVVAAAIGAVLKILGIDIGSFVKKERAAYGV